MLHTVTYILLHVKSFLHFSIVSRLSRPVQGEEDFWRVLELLVNTFPITPIGFKWNVRRYESAGHLRFGPIEKPLIG